MKSILVCVVVFLATLFTADASVFYVSVNGSSRGLGTITATWDLQTALSHPFGVLPGDTILILGGVYKGVFESTLRGREGSPIIVRAYPGQEVTLDGNVPKDADGVLNINGQHTWYWGLTITNSDSIGDNYYKDGVYFIGPNNKLINCIIHNNGGNGIGFWRPAINSEIYGCIIYHNGFKGTSRGHGHGIYAQNESGTKFIRDNIIFNSYGIGIHIYTEGGSIQGFLIEGNTIFNSGMPGSGFIERNILVGGGQPADRVSIKNNFFYNRPGYPSKASVQLGYSVANRNGEFSGNYMVDGTLQIIKGWNAMQVLDNKLLSHNEKIQLISFDNFSNLRNPVFNNNNYFRGTISSNTFNDWQKSSGQDRNSQYSSSIPSQTMVSVHENRYDKGRGHIIVYNWDNNDEVSVNLLPFLSRGDYFRVYDALNMFGAPVLEGVYKGGAVSLSLKSTAFDLPIRADSNRDALTHTLPGFGVFVVQSQGKEDIQIINPGIVSEALPLKISKCYPNPTVDILAVEFYSPEQKTVFAKVFDDSGKGVINERYNAIMGTNIWVTNLAALSGGVYIVSISDGDKRTTCRVLKRDFAMNNTDFDNIAAEEIIDKD
jgi:hypothetical protein